jgi:hypothetical protein
MEENMMKQFGRSIQFACVALLMCAGIVLGQPKQPAQPANISPELKSQIERALATDREQHGGTTPAAYVTKEECTRLGLTVYTDNTCPSYHACVNTSDKTQTHALCTSD